MSMTEIETPAAKPTKRKRKPRRPPRRASFHKPAEPKTDFDGLTVADCCKACNESGCVISGQNYCGHPRKGGLQGSSQQDAAALKRYQAAQKLLARITADKRFA